MLEGLPSNGSMADIWLTTFHVSHTFHVSQNVSHETFTQQEIQLSADMTDMADIKKTTNSSNTGNKFVDRFNVGDFGQDRRQAVRVKAADPDRRRGCDLGVVKEIEGDFYSSNGKAMRARRVPRREKRIKTAIASVTATPLMSWWRSWSVPKGESDDYRGQGRSQSQQ